MSNYDYESIKRNRKATTAKRPSQVHVRRENGRNIVSIGADTYTVPDSRLQATIKMLETISNLPDADRPHVELLGKGVLIRHNGHQVYGKLLGGGEIEVEGLDYDKFRKTEHYTGDIPGLLKTLKPGETADSSKPPHDYIPVTPGPRRDRLLRENAEWQTAHDAKLAERREANRDNKLAAMIKTFIESPGDNGAGDEVDEAEIGQSHLDKIRRTHRAIDARSRHLKARALLLDTDPTASLADKQAARAAWIESYAVSELPDDEVSRWLGEKPAEAPGAESPDQDHDQSGG